MAGNTPDGSLPTPFAALATGLQAGLQSPNNRLGTTELLGFGSGLGNPGVDSGAAETIACDINFLVPGLYAFNVPVHRTNPPNGRKFFFIPQTSRLWLLQADADLTQNPSARVGNDAGHVNVSSLGTPAGSTAIWNAARAVQPAIVASGFIGAQPIPNPTTGLSVGEAPIVAEVVTPALGPTVLRVFWTILGYYVGLP